MILVNNFSQMTVLVTGGTRGIGFATALAFAKCGARTIVTHRWGTTPDDEIIRAFQRAGARAPLIVECDVADKESRERLFDEISKVAGGVDVFVSNVAFGATVSRSRDFKLRSLMMTIERSLWPIVDYTSAIKTRFGKTPKYILAMSSYGHLYWTPNYDLIAATKAALEVISVYMATRLHGEGCCVNVIRPAVLDTDSAEATFGRRFIEVIRREVRDSMIEPGAVADCALALCSGLMDGVTGQVIDLDQGCRYTEAIYLEKAFQLAPNLETTP